MITAKTATITAVLTVTATANILSICGAVSLGVAALQQLARGGKL